MKLVLVIITLCRPAGVQLGGFYYRSAWVADSCSWTIHAVYYPRVALFG